MKRIFFVVMVAVTPSELIGLIVLPILVLFTDKMGNMA
jgi:hypothetical protein